MAGPNLERTSPATMVTFIIWYEVKRCEVLTYSKLRIEFPKTRGAIAMGEFRLAMFRKI